MQDLDDSVCDRMYLCISYFYSRSHQITMLKEFSAGIPSAAKYLEQRTNQSLLKRMIHNIPPDPQGQL
jgi:hypothetical protein